LPNQSVSSYAREDGAPILAVDSTPNQLSSSTDQSPSIPVTDSAPVQEVLITPDHQPCSSAADHDVLVPADFATPSKSTDKGIGVTNCGFNFCLFWSVFLLFGLTLTLSL